MRGAASKATNRNANKYDVPGGPTTGKAFYVEVLLYRESDSAHVGFAGVAFDLD